jgi:hypothetical protein
MAYGLHVIQFPSGRFGYVGSVPTDLGFPVPADKSAVMGGRSFRGEDGNLWEWKWPSFHSEAEALAYASHRGHPANPVARAA